MRAFLLQLMDMGFSREAVVQVLRRTNSIEAAMDHLLANPQAVAPPEQPPAPAAPVAEAPAPVAPPAPTATGVVGQEQMQAILDMDVSDDEEMLRAIAMSLGQHFTTPPTQRQSQGEQASTSAAADTKNNVKKAEKVEVVEAEEVPLDVAVIDEFTQTMIAGDDA